METLSQKKTFIDLHSWQLKNLKIVLFDLKTLQVKPLIAHNLPKPVGRIIGQIFLKKSKAIIGLRQPISLLKNKKSAENFQRFFYSI